MCSKCEEGLVKGFYGEALSGSVKGEREKQKVGQRGSREGCL